MKFFIVIITLILVLSGYDAHAQADKGGNGGDNLEQEFIGVRNEIKDWILNDGYLKLDFSKIDSSPSPLTPAQYYRSQMLEPIEHAKIEMTDEKLYAENEEKVCVNFRPTSESNYFLIRCNRELWKQVPESKRIKLVHHEYAGLAKLEKTAIYTLSNQIERKLDHKIVSTISLGGEQEYQLFCLIDLNGKFSGESYNKANLNDDYIILTIDSRNGHLLTKKVTGPKGNYHPRPEHVSDGMIDTASLGDWVRKSKIPLKASYGSGHVEIDWKDLKGKFSFREETFKIVLTRNMDEKGPGMFYIGAAFSNLRPTLSMSCGFYDPQINRTRDIRKTDIRAFLE